VTRNSQEIIEKATQYTTTKFDSFIIWLISLNGIEGNLNLDKSVREQCIVM